MKKLLLLVITLSLILSPLGIQAEETEEVIFCDSFEYNILANWDYYTLATKSYVMQTEGTYTDGTISVYISDTSTEKTAGLVSKPFAVTPGETYTAALDIYVTSGTSIRGYIKFFSDDGASLLAKSFLTKDSEKWTAISYTAVAPENATKATFTICGTGKEEGSAFVDNARVYKGTPVLKSVENGVFSTDAVPEEIDENIIGMQRETIDENHGTLIFEESFENGYSHWTLNGPEFENQVKLTEQYATDGKYAVYVTDNSADNTPALKSPFIDVKPGETYTLSGSLYIPESASVKYFFKFFDQNKVQINTTSISNKSESTARVALAATAPENAAYCQVWICGIRASIGDAYADDIKIQVGNLTKNVTQTEFIPPKQVAPVDAKIIAPSGDKLIYNTYNEQGDKLSDFSYAGFYAGEYELPDISKLPVAAILEPATSNTDDTSRIQAAIDKADAENSDDTMKIVKLKAGIYNINSEGLKMKSGIILSGEGQGPDGTILYAYAATSGLVVNFHGKEPTRVGSISYITDKYVKAGSYTFNISPEEIDNYKVGDLITVYHPSTERWGQALGMNPIINVYNNNTAWKDGNVDMSMERTIKAINGTEITVDIPMYVPLDTSLSDCYIYKTDESGKLINAGIENLRIDSYFDRTITDAKKRYTDENHAATGVSFKNAKNCYAKDVTVLHTWSNAFKCSNYAKQITIKNCSSLEPVSTVSGARRYSFACSSDSQQILISGCYSSEGRHDFETSFTATGPIVFCDNVVESSYAATETHGTWSTGVLYDNLYAIRNEDGGFIAISNHGVNGTAVSQGWTSAGAVVWNSLSSAIIAHKPYLTYQNFVVGTWGIYDDEANKKIKENKKNSYFRLYRTTDLWEGKPEFFETKEGTPVIGDAYKEAEFTPVNPGSIFKAQLSERYTGSYKNTKPEAPILTSPKCDTLQADEKVIIKGITKLGAEKATVYVDNKPYTVIPDKNNEFSVEITLAKGTHKIYATQTTDGIEGAKNADRFITIGEYNGNPEYLSSSYSPMLSSHLTNDNRISFDEFLNNKIKVYVNGNILKSDIDPIKTNNRVLVPMRAIFEALNAEVVWDSETSSALASKDGIVVKITENSNIAYIDDKEYLLDVPATILNGRFVVPVRFISESFGAEVGWIEETQTVKINQR